MKSDETRRVPHNGQDYPARYISLFSEKALQ